MMTRMPWGCSPPVSPPKGTVFCDLGNRSRKPSCPAFRMFSWSIMAVKTYKSLMLQRWNVPLAWNILRKTHEVLLRVFIKILMETESSLLCQLQQRHMYGNHIRPRSGRVCFPTVNSDSSRKGTASGAVFFLIRKLRKLTHISRLPNPCLSEIKSKYGATKGPNDIWKCSEELLFINLICFFKPTLGLFGVDLSFLNSVLTKYWWRG